MAFRGAKCRGEGSNAVGGCAWWTYQGSQFTATSFIQVLQRNRIKISMDGRDSWRDNVFVERLWKSVEYEEVYLHAYDSVAAAKDGIGKYLAFYNGRHPLRTPTGFRPPLLSAQGIYSAALTSYRRRRRESVSGASLFSVSKSTLSFVGD